MQGHGFLGWGQTGLVKRKLSSVTDHVVVVPLRPLECLGAAVEQMSWLDTALIVWCLNIPASIPANKHDCDVSDRQEKNVNLFIIKRLKEAFDIE